MEPIEILHRLQASLPWLQHDQCSRLNIGHIDRLSSPPDPRRQSRDSSLRSVAIRTIQRLVKKVANKPKIARHVTQHPGRHTHAVTALQRGIALASLQSVLGYDNIETTAISLNISREEAAREYREKW